VLSFDEIFNCVRCGLWYPREYEGPDGECQPCFCGIRVKVERAIPGSEIAVMMARELEALLLA